MNVCSIVWVGAWEPCSKKSLRPATRCITNYSNETLANPCRHIVFIFYTLHAFQTHVFLLPTRNPYHTPNKSIVLHAKRTPEDAGVEGKIFQAYSIPSTKMSLYEVDEQWKIVMKNQRTWQWQGTVFSMPEKVFAVRTRNKIGNGGSEQRGFQQD